MDVGRYGYAKSRHSPEYARSRQSPDRAYSPPPYIEKALSAKLNIQIVDVCDA